MAELKEIVALGIPIAVTITAEAGLFSAVSILVGTRGAEITAAHQISLNFAATMFMIPLALSAAITIRTGHALGSGNSTEARFAGMTGLMMCVAFMTCSAAFLLLFRDLVVAMYTNDPAVTQIAISLLLMAAIFQIADGLQIGAAGALRGYKDTRMPMVINTFSYWVLGFPLAYMAAITFQAPPSYIWAGLVRGRRAADGSLQYPVEANDRCRLIQSSPWPNVGASPARYCASSGVFSRPMILLRCGNLPNCSMMSACSSANWATVSKVSR